MFGSVLTCSKKFRNIFHLVDDVKDGDDLADEGAVVLLLDVGDQQVEGARALNRSLLHCPAHSKGHLQGHCQNVLCSVSNL